MELDPHILQQIITRIEQQMRCPQCGKRVPVDFSAVRIAGDGFLILQLKCQTCDAFIVLHAALQGQLPGVTPDAKDQTVNASSALHLKDDEVAVLRKALDHCDGSFEKLFKMVNPENRGPSVDSVGGDPGMKLV